MNRGKGLARGKPLERGSGLARGKGLERGKPLDRGKGLERGESQLDRGAPMRQRSPTRERHMRTERRPLVERLAAAGVKCEIRPVLEEAGIPHHCTYEIGGMHERRKSGAGGSRVRGENLIPACNWCNGFLEDEPELIRRLTGSVLVLRETEEEREEWERMSKRRDHELDNL